MELNVIGRMDFKNRSKVPYLCQNGRVKQNKFITDVDPEFKELLEGFKRQALHAKSIGFIHPTTKKEIEFECEKPKDFENLLKTIKKLKF